MIHLFILDEILNVELWKQNKIAGIIFLQTFHWTNDQTDDTHLCFLTSWFYLRVKQRLRRNQHWISWSSLRNLDCDQHASQWISMFGLQNLVKLDKCCSWWSVLIIISASPSIVTERRLRSRWRHTEIFTTIIVAKRSHDDDDDDIITISIEVWMLLLSIRFIW